MTDGASAAPCSALLLGFGQSNADVHDAGPRQIPRGDAPCAVVAPDDGTGIRGLMGRVRSRTIEGFVPATRVEPKIQSLLAAAGLSLLDRPDPPTRVIVRSEARGGRRFLGFLQDDREIEGILRNHDGTLSQIFTNLIKTAGECVAASRADGCPVDRIHILFIHGESDRGLAREAYSVLLDELVHRVEEALSDLDLPIVWFAVQAAGTGGEGGGNNWPNRLSLLDMAAARPNFHVVCAGYPYPLHDQMHYSATGKLLLGELLGDIVARARAGTVPTAPTLAGLEREGARIILRFRADDPLVLDRAAAAGDPRPTADTFGFTVTRRHAPILREVTLGGADTVLLDCDPEADLTQATVAYAFARNSHDGIDVPAGAAYGRGYLRTERAVPSRFVPGETLHDWALGFECHMKDICDDRPNWA